MEMMEVPGRFGSDTSYLGCWLRVPSPTTAEIAARAGFDYVCVDMQHGLADRNALLAMLQARRDRESWLRLTSDHGKGKKHRRVRTVPPADYETESITG